MQSSRKVDINKEKYGVDASIFRVEPKNVYKVESITELQNIVLESDHITARAGGTCMSGGSLTEYNMVDITNLNKVIEINTNDTQNNFVWIESGIMYRDLEKELEKYNRFFAPYTSSKNICSVAGMLGNNASGEKSLTYGPTNKNVLAVEMMMYTGETILFETITDDEMKEKRKMDTLEGKIYANIYDLYTTNLELIKSKKPKTNKNAAGYNIFDIYNQEKNSWSLVPIIIGSQSTLGIITHAKLKIYPILPYSHMVVIPFDHVHDLPNIVKICVESGATSIECFDDNTYNLAKIHMASDANMAILSNNKKITVFAEFCSNIEKEVIEKSKLLVNKLGIEAHDVTNDSERNSYWEIRRASFKLLKDFAPIGYKAIPIIEDTIVDINIYDEFLKDLLEVLYNYDMKYTYAGHIGDGSIRLIPLIKIDTPDAEETILKMAEDVYKVVMKYSGSISTDHNDGLARSYYLPEFYNERFYEVLKSIKNIFDPENKFNPGKKIGGSRDYSKSKIYLK